MKRRSFLGWLGAAPIAAATIDLDDITQPPPLVEQPDVDTWTADHDDGFGHYVWDGDAWIKIDTVTYYSDALNRMELPDEMIANLPHSDGGHWGKI